jgi:hypothetical protein
VTISIDQDRQQRARHPAVAAEPVTRCGRLIIAIHAVLVVAVLAGLVLVGIDIDLPHGIRFAIYAAACFMTSALCAALLVMHAMLADRQEFYRRGQLDGWMKGWRGLEPDVDDPLLR